MTVRIRGNTRIKSQTLVGFPPQPALNLNFTQGYANGLNPLPSTVTFTRADSAAVATQVGPDGLVRLAAHNVLLRSQTFDNAAWSAPSATVTTTTAITAPDGTLTAYKIVAAAGGIFPASGVSSASNYVTASLYVCAEAGNSIKLRVNEYGSGSNYIEATVTFSSATITAVANGFGTVTGYSLTPVGGGWFRISLSGQPSSSGGTCSFYINTTAGAYIWGAQLEVNRTPSYYVPTTTAAVYANTPRFDYSPVTTEPLGLLIEEARTNNFAGSQNLSNNTYWNQNGISSRTENVIGPDGQQSLTTITENTLSSQHNLFAASANRQSLSGTVTLSFYIKAGTRRYMTALAYNNNLNGFWVCVDTGVTPFVVTQTGVVGTGTYTTSTVTDAGNGIYRVSLTGVCQATSVLHSASFSGASSATPGTYDQTYLGSGLSIIMGCVQLEAGSFPTSYIPTTTAAVPRVADVATVSNLALMGGFSAAGGTLYAEVQTPNVSQLAVPAEFNSSSYNNSMSFTKTDAGGNVAGNYYNLAAYDGVTTLINLTANASDGNLHRLAGSWGASGISGVADGGTVGTGTARSPVPTKFNIGQRDGTQYWINGTIRRIQYWPARFSNAQLQLITKG